MISNIALNICFKWFGVLTTQHNQTLQHFDQFYMLGLNIKGNKLWKGDVGDCDWKYMGP